MHYWWIFTVIPKDILPHPQSEFLSTLQRNFSTFAFPYGPNPEVVLCKVRELLQMQKMSIKSAFIKNAFLSIKAGHYSDHTSARKRLCEFSPFRGVRVTPHMRSFRDCLGP